MPAAKKPTSPVELTDIETQEVSLVDKAANKRKWVLRKAAGTVVKSDGKGAFVPVEEPKVDPTPAPATELPAQGAISKATKGAIQSTIDKLTSLLTAPDAESDAADTAALLTKALDAFETEPAPELNPQVLEMLKKPAELSKAATGCAMKLLEIAQALSLRVDETTAENYPCDLKWKIQSVLDALTTMSWLERDEPGAAAVVAAAVFKAEAPATDTAAHTRLKNVALSLQKALYSELHTSETTDVNLLDSDQAERLLGTAVTIIKSLKAKVDEYESRPAPSNALSPESEPAQKSTKTVWANDMAAAVAEEDRATRSRK